jgi:tetrahydromethanopterin S-methyltransferase subunit G
MENIQQFFQDNPRLFGIVLIVFGIIIFMANKLNAKWFFGTNRNTYNLNKMDGWINLFGKKAGKIIGYGISIGIIISGIVFIVLWK